MVVLMVILRILHIISGVFWMGAGMMNVYFVSPSARALGQDGQKFTGHLLKHTRFVPLISAAAGLTFLTGLLMYWWIFGGINLSSGYGWGMTVGGLFGTVAFIIATAYIMRPANKMKTLLGQVETAGRPPSPEQAAQMQALGATLGKGGTWAVITGLLATIGMSAAQYLNF